MKIKSKAVFDLASLNPPVPGCTVSEVLKSEGDYRITSFSLSGGTSISAEIYSAPKLLVVLDGDFEIFGGFKSRFIGRNSLIVIPKEVPAGIRTKGGGVYIEIEYRGNFKMNDILKAGEVKALKDLVSYSDGKIVNMDLIDDEKLKYALMAFDAGTGLSEHAAPGEAIVTALDGEGIIGYEGKEYLLKAGESFKFDRGGRHFVKANKKFKMSLLLTLK